MDASNQPVEYKPVISLKLGKILKKQKRKNPQIVLEIEQQMDKILNFPEIGKPLRHGMKHQRRVHIGSFVLVYEIVGNEIRFLDFDHHDKIYKRKI